MRKLFFLFAVLIASNAFAFERETVWPKGKMPHRQDHQIAAMTDETSDPKFKADKHRVAYLEWFDAPSEDVRNGACVILISGGSYQNCCDVSHIKNWREMFTREGIQCVNFVYRTPRPVGLPIYQTAWEDAQRAVRMVRSEAKKRGFDPDKIGVCSMSAGSHLGLLLAANSQTSAYDPIDALDTIPCNINFAILHAPAYVTTDGETGTPALRQGYGVDVKLSKVFNFDEKTCPISMHHGGNDPYSPNGSTLVYRQLRRMKVPAELHLYPNRGHGVYGTGRGIEFIRQLGLLKPLEKPVPLMDRYTSDASQTSVTTEDIWPEGMMPNPQDDQCKPYIEWHMPKELKTRAIQIIYSGGAYYGNDPSGFEVAPARRYLNDMGMAVVIMKYRTPRPNKESGLAKHVSAWQDLQRAIRIVRSEAAARGLCPDSIGIMGSSAGAHLTMMGVTSSMQQSYLPIDDIDKLPCNVQWGLSVYLAYALTDGADDPGNKQGGNEDDNVLVPEFNFDLKTAPMLFVHGDADNYASMNSVKVWEKMRSIGVQCELHTFALRPHGFHAVANPGTGSYNVLDRIGDFLKEHVKFSK